MKTPIRFLAMLFGSLFVIAGSSQAGASAFGPPPADRVDIVVSSTSVTTNSTATLTVTVTRNNGAPENDGTIISATASPPAVGTIAGTNTGGTGTGSTSSLVGGSASFVFIAGSTPGTATITISLPPVNGYPNTVVKRISMTVMAPQSGGGDSNPSLLITPLKVELPQNRQDVGPYLGSPYMAELKVQWSGLITGQPLNGKINVAISPVEVASFSMLDDPTTPWVGQTKTPPTAEGNEFLTKLGSGPVPVVAGVGTIFVHAGSTAGTATLTISATDPETNRTITSQMTVTVNRLVTGAPASITLSQDATGVYVNGSNGPQSKLVTASVTDAGGAVVDDPPMGTNNVQFQIVGPTGTDARLYTVDAGGVPRTTTTVKTATLGGSAFVSLLAGSVQGPVQIQATTDGFDGNIDNGITSPVSATATVIVSDGRLYSLTITSPIVNAIAVNGITPSSSSSSGSTTPTIPLQPDATYSLTVSAIATDRQGNPVLPGTAIRFGVIDTPQAFDYTSTCGLGAFQICGNDGNPNPGTTSFSAPNGFFSAGGAGPGDTLVVFGKQVHGFGAPAGNDDLESALSIGTVAGDKQLYTVFPFNNNDTSGKQVAPGPVLPYVIGRATIGNINSPVTTDSTGRATVTGTATTKLNYPVSQLNRSVVIWAQGTGLDTAVGGSPTTRLVTDAIVTTYPALADLSISASPNPITGNVTTPVTVCIVDALRVPVPNVRIHYGFSNLGVGTGSVDGQDGALAGWTKNATGSSGCVTASVTTSGIAGGSSSGGSSGTPTLTFTAAGYAPGSGASVAIPIVAGGNLILLVSPSAIDPSPSGSGGQVTLTLRSSNGNAVSGVQLTGSCTGDTVNLLSIPGTTDQNGQTTATIGANLDAYGTAGSGTCTFTTATGSPTATVNLKGVNLCLSDPTNSACSTGGGTGGGTGNKLTIIVNASASLGSGTVVASLGGGSQFSPGASSNFTCSAAAGKTNTCNTTVPTAVTSVGMKATAGTGGTFGSWSSTCNAADSSASTTTIPISGATTCTATFQ